MADNSALLASLLVGQKQRQDPIQGQRKYGEGLMLHGASTTPVQSPLEGLARALQGGLGGYFAGEADRREEEKGQKTVAGLSGLLKAKPNTPEWDAALAGIKGDPDVLAPIIGQMLTTKMAEAHKAELAGTNAGVFRTAFGAPGQPPAAPNPGGYQGTLGGLESSNNPQAVNPQSGAAGQFQFMPQTWAEVRKANPDLNLPDSPLQAPPQLQAQAEQRFREQNAKILQAAGIEPTPANLYLAHRAGAQGAQTILGASPDAPLSTVVPPEWIAQNPDMKTTVGQFVQNAQQRFGGAQGGQGGQPGPLTINMTPSVPPQGSGDGRMPTGAAPQMAPQQAPQAPPQAMPQAPAIPDMPRPQPTQEEIQRYSGLVQTGQMTVPQAKAALDADIDRRWGVDRERAKMAFEQQTSDYKDERTRAQPSRAELEKLHAARTEATSIASALSDFEREFQNTGTWGSIKSVAGATTPVNTAYNMAALLAKGQALFDLGVLNGPDLDIIRRTLPDPSTIRGASASNTDMSAAVGKVIDLLQTRLASREKQLGLPITDVRGSANDLRATQPGGPTPQPAAGPIAAGAVEAGSDGVPHRFKGGNPADPKNWEAVR